MNKVIVIIVLFLLTGCQTIHAIQAPQKDLTGIVTSHTLLEQYPEFKTEFDNYQPSAVELEAVQTIQGKKLVVLFGTWCHDSVREVPRLLKLLEISAVKLSDVQLIAVDYNKQDPSDLHQIYRLKYTPTIILLDGDQELGRIIEKPLVSLASDLAGFL
ncbi:MAG: thioredoxin 1 [Paraglaciecola sp.]|jgi:thioredoxin 1